MADYNVIFNTNALNRSGNLTKQTDIAYTENLFFTKSGKLVSEYKESVEEIINTNLDEVILINSKYMALGTDDPKYHYGIYIKYSGGGTIYSGIYKFNFNKKEYTQLTENFSSDPEPNKVYEVKLNSFFFKQKGCSVFKSGNEIFFTFGNGENPRYVRLYKDGEEEILEVVKRNSTPIELDIVTPYYSFYVGNEKKENPHVIHFSDSEQPNEFGSLTQDYLVIGENDDKILAMQQYSGYLYIFKERSVFLLVGGSLIDASVTELTGEIGIFSSSSYCIKNNTLYFISNNIELYMIQDNTFTKLISREEMKLMFYQNFTMDSENEPIYDVDYMGNFFDEFLDYDCKMIVDDSGNGFYFAFYNKHIFSSLYDMSKIIFWGYYDTSLNNLVRINNNFLIGNSPNEVTIMSMFFSEGERKIKVYQNIKYNENVERNISENAFFTHVDKPYEFHYLEKDDTFIRALSKENILITKKLLDDGQDKRLKHIHLNGLFPNARIFIFTNSRDDSYQDIYNTISENIKHKDNPKYDYFNNVVDYRIIDIKRSEYETKLIMGDSFFNTSPLSIDKSIRIRPISGKYFTIAIVLFFEEFTDNEVVYKGIQTNDNYFINRLSINYDIIKGRNKKY